MVDKPAEAWVDKPAEGLVDKPAEVLVDKPAEVLVGKPAEVLMDKAVEAVVGGLAPADKLAEVQVYRHVTSHAFVADHLMRLQIGADLSSVIPR